MKELHQINITKKSKKNSVATGGGSQRRNIMMGNFLSADPRATLYSSDYRIKNIGELKRLSLRGTDQPTLSWMTSLRPNLGNNSEWSIKPTQQ